MNVLEVRQAAVLEVSAASGCVVRDGRVFVVADDDPHLWAFSLTGERLERLRLLSGVMPVDPSARKAVKPDLESLTLLPDGSLLALGSGSTPRRRRAALVRDGRATPIDCTQLFVALEQEFDALNLEAAVIDGDQLVLGQRGNGPGLQNALVRLSLRAALASFAAGELTSSAIEGIEPLRLGELDGVPLTLTDLARGDDGRLVFSAAAEDTTDPYLDGVCRGSVVGTLAGGRVTWSARLEGTLKVEGLAQYDATRWVMVVDADDPAVKAKLLLAPPPGPA
jgi:hypothetical protein